MLIVWMVYPPDSLSCGVTIAIACGVTFILTLTVSVIITIIVTYTIVKKKDVQATTGKHSLYETVHPPSSTTSNMELQLNPAYATSDKVIMDNNPAYVNYK